MKNPIWITVDDGDVFVGHQGHWADCFFTNAYRAEIEDACKSMFREPVKLEIREMTDEEVLKYPEAITFRDWLIDRYGEC